MDQTEREVVFNALLAEGLDAPTAFAAADVPDEPDGPPGTNWAGWAAVLGGAAFWLWWLLRP